MKTMKTQKSAQTHVFNELDQATEHRGSQKVLFVLNRFQKLPFSAVYTETMRFQKVAFSNNSTLESVFKKLRFHSQIFLFHVDSKLRRKNKVAFSFENVSV